METQAPPSRRPEDTPFKQQRLPAWQPILTPERVIAIFLVIGIVFIPVGVELYQESDSIVEFSYQYDGSGAASTSTCQITEEKNTTTCTFNITLDQSMSSPVWVYYELTNFYQNHRRYVKSRSSSQLLGSNLGESSVSSDCDPLYKVNGELLNPCGLIANSLFNDVISLETPDLTLVTTGISWKSDRDDKFKQVDGFKYAQCSNSTSNCSCASALGSSSTYSSCKTYVEDGVYYKYYYPDDSSVKYLYESYPKVVSPIQGVTNEHFIVWMRTAGLPDFRKPYGKIEQDLPKDTVLQFKVHASFLVSTFDGTKSLVVSEIGTYGGKNPFLGVAYVVIGCVCLLLATVFGIKHLVNPRPLGDTRFLGWQNK